MTTPEVDRRSTEDHRRRRQAQRIAKLQVAHSGKRVRLQDGRRVCGWPECDVVLSRYNMTDCCSIHAEEYARTYRVYPYL